jgi:hypothetical protein
VGADTTIAGTGSDATSGVASVAISVQEGTGSCFDTTAQDFTATCPNWISSTGTTNWTKSLADKMFFKGISYTVSSKATDTAGNIQTSFGSASFTFTASEGSNLWNTDITFDRAGGDDRALAGATDASGNIYVVGYQTSGDKNWLLKKYSIRGVEDTSNWNKDVGDPGVDEIASSVATDSSGNVYVAGSRWNGSDWDWMIKKYSSSGTEDTANWDMLIDSGNGDDEALGIATDSSGNVYIAGYGNKLAGASSGADLWMKKFSSSGVFSCEIKLDEGGANLADKLTSIAVNSASAKVFVAGYKTVTGPDAQMIVKRFRASDCSVEASATGNSAGTGDYATSVKLDASGNVIVAGVNSAAGTDWWIRKYTSSLALSSEHNPAGATTQIPLAVAVDSSGKIYAGGYQTNAGQDLWLRQFSSTLVENVASWNLVLNPGGSSDQVTATVISGGTGNTDHVYMIGWSGNVVSGSSGNDWFIRKLAGP